MALELNFETERSCCFTGHRIINAETQIKLRAVLPEIITDLISQGYNYFFCGCALGFDLICADVVLELSKEYPVKLVAVIPCDNQSALWSDYNRLMYGRIIKEVHYAIKTGDRASPENMRIRNRYMVDHSELCVAFYERKKSGTAYTVNYALRNKKRVINVYEMIENGYVQEKLF